jgi:vacuolar-type H+-ATPase subunit F/Vma7
VGAVAVIGEEALVCGYALAGATVLVADTADEVRAAWLALPEGTDVVILTAAAADADPDRVTGDRPIVAVMR